MSLKSVVYRGNKFKINSGKYIVDKDFENFINCSVFILALLETYDTHILDWNDWPTVSEASKNPYLKLWLEDNKIPEKEQEEYYNFNKEIKGKHVLSCTLLEKLPAKYTVAEEKSNEVLNYLSTI